MRRCGSPSRALVLASTLVAFVYACNGKDKDKPPPNVTEKPLQKVVLEIDQMAGTPQIPLKVRAGDADLALADIFKPAGIQLEVRRDRTDLPRAPEVTLGNLHDMMVAPNAHAPVAADEIGVHLIVATRELDHPRDLGIMFDYGDVDTDNYPREGFAIFADVHDRFGAGRDAELMLTAAHELTHVLNLHHSDWEPGRSGATFDKGSTIESYSPASDVKWALSAASRQHLLEHPPREKWPGRGNMGFGFLLPEHSQHHQPDPAAERDRWTIVDASGVAAKGRYVREAALAAARRLPRDPSQFTKPADALASLKLEVPRTTYEVGEPITVTVGVHNTSSSAVHVRPLLDPSYGFLRVDIQLPGTDVYLPFRPVVTREAHGVKTEVLAPGRQIHDEAKVFFGAGGWTFHEPGTYRIRADFPTPARDEAGALATAQRIQSEVREITVVAPRTEAGASARTALLGMREGLGLLIGSASQKLVEVAQMAESSPQIDAARLAVATSLVNPTPGAAETSGKDLGDALKYLSQTKKAAVGPFSVAQTYDQVADTLEQQGRKAEAVQVRQKLKERLAKVEGGTEAIKRVEARK